MKTLSSNSFLVTVGNICRCQLWPCLLPVDKPDITYTLYNASICHKETKAHPLALTDSNVKCSTEIIVEGIVQSVKVMEYE